MESIEEVAYKMRWKLFHFKKDKRKKLSHTFQVNNEEDQPIHLNNNIAEENSSNNEFYGLRSNLQAPKDPDLRPFENDLVLAASHLIKRNFKSNFQDQIKEIELNLRKTDKIVISSDKTDNHYLISKEDYLTHLRNCITKSYKKSSIEEVHNADYEAACLAKQLGLEWRLEKTALKCAFITVKVHKEGWPKRLTFRLINPMKSNIGKISKVILERINKDLRRQLELNQLISTKEVITWFQNIKDKKKKTFFQADIENFYPSISEELLRKALTWAKDQTYISDTAVDIIFSARRNVLYDGDNIWVKKNNSKFDIGMGAFDGAECSELIGLYMLFQLVIEAEVIGKEEICLYRDDILGTLSCDGPNMDRKRKDIIRIFKNEGLSVTCEINLKTVKFLDVCFNLENNSYKPYHKPNSKVQYVSTGSNHPKLVLDNIPIGINQRLSSISSDLNAFDSEKNAFQDALIHAGHKFNMNFNNQQRKKRLGNINFNNLHQLNCDNNKRIRKNIIWLNQPFNLYSVTHIRRIFGDLVDKHFSRWNYLGKLFNENKLEVSYK